MLEEDLSLPFLQKIALATLGMVSIPLAPVLYVYHKIYGNHNKREGRETEAYEKRMAKKSKNKESLSYRLAKFAFRNGVDERNKVMAERSIDIFTKYPGNLLIVCGEGHLDGLVENLSRSLRLKELKEF